MIARMTIPLFLLSKVNRIRISPSFLRQISPLTCRSGVAFPNPSLRNLFMLLAALTCSACGKLPKCWSAKDVRLTLTSSKTILCQDSVQRYHFFCMHTLVQVTVKRYNALSHLLELFANRNHHQQTSKKELPEF